MKKIYTIGREEGCDIVIPDNSNVISRLHATIRFESEKRIYITDQSRNGTYVNGIKISSNVEVPVSRRDVISLAHVIDFDWSLIPKQRSRLLVIATVIVFIIIVLGGVFAFKYLSIEKPNEEQSLYNIQQQVEMPKVSIKEDSVATKDTITDKPKKKERVSKPRTEKKKDSVNVEKPKEEIYNPIY